MNTHLLLLAFKRFRSIFVCVIHVYMHRIEPCSISPTGW